MKGNVEIEKAIENENYHNKAIFFWQQFNQFRHFWMMGWEVLEWTKDSM